MSKKNKSDNISTETKANSKRIKKVESKPELSKDVKLDVEIDYRSNPVAEATQSTTGIYIRRKRSI